MFHLNLFRRILVITENDITIWMSWIFRNNTSRPANTDPAMSYIEAAPQNCITFVWQRAVVRIATDDMLCFIVGHTQSLQTRNHKRFDMSFFLRIYCFWVWMYQVFGWSIVTCIFICISYVAYFSSYFDIAQGVILVVRFWVWGFYKQLWHS